jgi:UDP-N-acetylmuramate dehydrogenase
MPEIIENASLKGYNTFGIDVKARYLCFYQSPDDLKNLIAQGPLHRDEQMIIIGAGSNILFTSDFNGVVIHPVNKYIDIIEETNDYCLVKAGAGTLWDTLVEWAVNKGLGGIENLSDIPGTVGAAPVQNIGAYGMEAKDTIYQVHLVSFEDGSTRTIDGKDCGFGYRTSIFKTKLKNRYLVDAVTFKLTKKPVFVTHYGSLQSDLEQTGAITLKNIRNTVIKIRTEKLPQPKEAGNAGSFFKNPIVDSFKVDKLKQQFPDIVTYPVDDVMIKLSAGWLIEHCGLKGFINQTGNAGVHAKQSLVLVNINNAKGSDILNVAYYVQKKVFEKFDICIEPEVLVL